MSITYAYPEVKTYFKLTTRDIRNYLFTYLRTVEQLIYGVIMKYHKLASFWILLAYLTFTGFNVSFSICMGLIFPFALFALELNFKFKEASVVVIPEPVSNPELEALQLEYDMENLRAGIHNTRKHISIQDASATTKKGNSLEDWKGKW